MSENKPVDEDHIVDIESVRAQIRRHKGWYHRIELAPGIVTPGLNSSANALEQLDELGLPADCSGMRALDIGCRDGFFSFELEKRGADVVAIDMEKAEHTGFPIAAKILGSKLELQTADVMNLDPSRYGRFDLVLFLGVLYHLRHPGLAMERILSVMKPKGLLFLETQISSKEPIQALDSPAWEYFAASDLRGDETNKWVPNVPAIQGLLSDTGFEGCKVSSGRERAHARARVPEEAEFKPGEYIDLAYQALEDKLPEEDAPFDPITYAKALRVLVDGREQHLASVLSQLGVVNETNTDLELEVAELRRVLSERDDQVDSLEGVLESRESELDSLRPVLGSCERELASIRQVLQARDEELESLRPVLEARNVELASIKSVLESRELEVADLRALLTKGEEELEEIKGSFFGRLAARHVDA